MCFFFALGACFALLLLLILNNTAVMSFLPVSNGDYTFAEALLMAFFSFPFAIIGKITALTAEAGIIGSGISLCIISLICALPLIPVLKTYKNKSCFLRNAVLCLMIPLLAVVFAVFCNNSFIYTLMPELTSDLADNVKSVFGAAVWSGIVTVLLSELIRKISCADGRKLLILTKLISHIIAVIFVIIISVFEVNTLYENLTNTNPGLADGYVSILSFIKEALQYILDIAVISSAIRLMDGVLENKPSDEIEYLSKRLSKRCTVALSVMLTVSFISNFIQIILSPVVFSNIFVEVDIPIFSIGFVLIILIVSLLVTENKKLKEDNDLFI